MLLTAFSLPVVAGDAQRPGARLNERARRLAAVADREDSFVVEVN